MTQPTFVFIPGLLSDDRVWRPVAEKIEAEGAHFADVTGADGITGMAQSVLDSVEGDLIVLGHSMGGRVAMEVARLAPKRVRGLVLANTGHGGLRDGEEETRRRKIELGHEDMDRLADEWLPPMVASERHDDDELMGSLRDMVLETGPEVHERQIRALLERPDASDYLGDLDCPILLIVGDRDEWSPVAQHEEIAALAQDAELQVIGGAGHFTPVERPNESAAVVEAWLERHLFRAAPG
ncbi:alpha/beta fold hydrolase [Aquicoccus sp. SCR17]|nr:alpha/beta fold hydrolase [Carideicomes alvinocaridis]